MLRSTTVSIAGACIVLSIKMISGAAATDPQPSQCKELVHLENLFQEKVAAVSDALKQDADPEQLCVLGQSSSAAADAVLNFMVANKACFPTPDVTIRMAKLNLEPAHMFRNVACSPPAGSTDWKERYIEEIKKLQLLAQQSGQTANDLIRPLQEGLAGIEEAERRKGAAALAATALAHGDYQRAKQILEPLALNGQAEAQTALGFMYEHGQGVVQDYAQAVKWYRLAANQGFSGAQGQLGRLYANGLGVSQDRSEALMWWKRAAAQGEARAQLMLGAAYADGYGVPQDFSSAYFWFNLAAAALPAGDGDEKALQMRDSILKRLTPEQIAEAQQRAHEWRPILEPRTDARAVPAAR